MLMTNVIEDQMQTKLIYQAVTISATRIFKFKTIMKTITKVIEIKCQ